MTSRPDSDGRVAYCLPIEITSSKTKCVRLRNGRSLQHPKTNLCPGDRRCHWKNNSCVVHCLYSQLRCIRTFRKMFSCLRRSDRRESDGMGHVCKQFQWHTQLSSIFSLKACEDIVLYIILLEVALKLSRFCNVARMSKVVGPRYSRMSGKVCCITSQSNWYATVKFETSGR